MVQFIKNNIKGDKFLWAFIAILALFSFLPVYSASSNLEYTVGSGSVFGHLVKHAAFLIVGMLIMVMIQKVDFKYFGGLAVLILPFTIVLLVVTLFQGSTIEGANAARWLKVPGTGFTIQPSTFASLILMIYIARYLTKNRNKEITLKNSLLPLFLPLFGTLIFIFPANGSTAVILFFTSMLLLFLGNYPIKILLGIFAFGTVFAGLFVFLALNFSDLIPSNRVDTWKGRIERFMDDDNIEDYQVKHAKAAIVQGGEFGKGPGKSVFKQTLPQSSSDFIYAIIVEEYGVIGGAVLIFLYMLILFRIIIIATKTHVYFGTLLVLAVGLPIIIQAILNIGVAASVFPVTGQPLPMISYGGTSMWITCLAFGIVLSVSAQIKTDEEIELERKVNSDEVIQDIA